MEVDGTSTSSDSSSLQYNNINTNFYTENIYLSQGARRAEFDGYFGKDFYSKSDKNRGDFFAASKKDNFPATTLNSTANSNNNNGLKTKSEDFAKKTQSYPFVSGYSKKLDDFVDSMKTLEYFNKKTENSNSIHLNNVDGFGKKSISFSPDQVIAFPQ